MPLTSILLLHAHFPGAPYRCCICCKPSHGCGGDLTNSGCSSTFTVDPLESYIRECRGLTQVEFDMALLGQSSAFTNNSTLPVHSTRDFHPSISPTGTGTQRCAERPSSFLIPSLRKGCAAIMRSANQLGDQKSAVST